MTIRTLATQQTINQFNKELSQLNWTWQHPKIQTFIQEVATRRNSVIALPSEASDYCLARLTKLLKLYRECQELMSLLRIDSRDSEIQSFLNKCSDKDRLLMEEWSAMHKELDERWWKASDIAF